MRHLADGTFAYLRLAGVGPTQPGQGVLGSWAALGCTLYVGAVYMVKATTHLCALPILEVNDQTTSHRHEIVAFASGGLIYAVVSDGCVLASRSF